MLPPEVVLRLLEAEEGLWQATSCQQAFRVNRINRQQDHTPLFAPPCRCGGLRPSGGWPFIHLRSHSLFAPHDLGLLREEVPLFLIMDSHSGGGFPIVVPLELILNRFSLRILGCRAKQH